MQNYNAASLDCKARSKVGPQTHFQACFRSKVGARKTGNALAAFKSQPSFHLGIRLTRIFRLLHVRIFCVSSVLHFVPSRASVVQKSTFGLPCASLSLPRQGLRP